MASVLPQAIDPTDSTDRSDLSELHRLPFCGALESVDLNLTTKDRVSALPWRGQFSPLTVARLLDALGSSHHAILDPFSGSGTVLLEAARRGQPAIGIDVNAAAVALSKCACLASLTPEHRLSAIELAKERAFGSGAKRRLVQEQVGVVHALAMLGNAMHSEQAAFVRIEKLLDDLPDEPVDIRAYVGDARGTELEDDSIGTVITSPPYINVFNYHQYGRPLTDDFGWPILQAARSEIGSNRQNRSNRFRTVVQYGIDMALALAEMSRVLLKGGLAVLVVGRESRVRQISFSNSNLIAGIARDLDCFDSRSRSERCFANRYGALIYEDVIVLTNAGALGHSVSEVEEIGRAAGVKALEQVSAEPEMMQEIDGAITGADQIASSPIATRFD